MTNVFAKGEQIMATPCRLKRTIIKDGELTVKELKIIRTVPEMEHFLRTNGSTYIGDNKWAITFTDGAVFIDEIVSV